MEVLGVCMPVEIFLTGGNPISIISSGNTAVIRLFRKYSSYQTVSEREKGRTFKTYDYYALLQAVPI